MAIAVPSLDDRAYADLVEEARGLIPVYDPSWTNHNASDPGITLIELFAWLTEMQIYALDQISDEHRVTFLRLLNGPELVPTRNFDQTIDKSWLDRETARTLDLLRKPSRAVSARDHEELAYQVPGVKRAQCVPRRNLEAGIEAACRLPAEGHVSVVVLPVREPDSNAVCTAVHEKLDKGRMLTTRLHVVPPTWVPVSTRVIVARRSGNLPGDVTERIQQRLAEWLSAWTGGEDRDGWRFGRDVHVSELNAVLEAVSGVDYVGEALLDSKAASGRPHEPPAEPIWHDSGALVGLALAPHHLPRSPAVEHKVLVADRLDPVDITVNVTPSTAKLPDARRAVLQSLKDELWRLQYAAYGNKSGFDLSADAIAKVLNDSADVRAVVSAVGTITIVADPARRDANTLFSAYHFGPGEFFQASCRVAP